MLETIRTLGRLLDDLERVRVMNGNRIGALERSGYERLPHLQTIQENLAGVEHQAQLELVRAWRKHPLAEWARDYMGLGEKSVARLIAEIGDPADRPSGVMTDRDRSWFGVSFDSGRKRTLDEADRNDGDPPRKPPVSAASSSARPPLDPIQAAVLRVKADVLEECAELARLYEKQGADAGFVRVVLSGRASSARRLVEDLCPLEEEPETLPTGSSSSGPGGTESSHAPGLGLTAIQTESSPGPLPANLIPLPVARDAGDICPRCGKPVTWLDHLPPWKRGQSVRCFAGFVAGYSVKVPDRPLGLA